MSNEHAHSREKNLFGFWIYLMSDCVLFAALFATYVVLAPATYGGPDAYELTNIPFVFVETMLLLVSSFTVGLAVVAAHQNKKNLTLGLLGTTLLLGFGFLAMELYEFGQLLAEGHGPTTSAFLSSFFTLLGTHGAHVFAGAVWMIALITHVMLKGLTIHNTHKLIMLSLFWHFLDIVWIFIFTFVYLFGALAL